MSHNEGTQENLGSNKDVRAELLDGFRAKYGEECKSEDIYLGDFQERCHSWATVQAACTNGSCPGSPSSSGG